MIGVNNDNCYSGVQGYRRESALDELIELFEYLAGAQWTFNPLYVEHELVILSPLLLPAGFPTLVCSESRLIIYLMVVEVLESPIS